MPVEVLVAWMMEQTTVNGRYRLDRKIGEGGMAEVYLGRDLLLQRDVAVKWLHAHYAADSTFRARFEREAQAAAGFAHPNIIDIYDVGEDSGAPYIVMEYVRGETLKDVIVREGPFHPDDVGALLSQVGAALDYAHERGYVHRDVKPQNILVDAHGRIKVVDFGIAKGLADSQLTETGAGLGTVHYLSPEQASGLMATPASDIYAAGVVAFEMLTRQLPFDADTAVGVAMQHVHDDPPPPSSLVAGTPPQVDALLARALAKDPTQRFPSAGAFARAMTNWRTVAPAAPVSLAAAPTGTITPISATRAVPAIPVPPPPAPQPAAARAVPVGRLPTVSNQRDEVGCVTWVIGSGILLGLVVLIWIGFRLSPNLAGLGGTDSDPTATATSSVLAAAPSPTAPANPSVTPPAASPTQPAPAVVAVPDLTGLSLADAEDAVTDRGLLLAVVDYTVYSEVAPVETVAEQDPPPNFDAPQASTVSVTMSRGSAEIPLNNLGLVGQTESEARSVLENRGIVVATDDVGSADVEEGRVVSFDPPGTVRVGETVTLHISAGNRVFIPAELQGQPLAQVQDQLTQMGLTVSSTVGVSQSYIESFEIDLVAADIRNGDVVGIEGNGAAFNTWVAPDTAVTLVYYDNTKDTNAP